MFHPTSASIKHKLDVNAMLTSIRQTRGRPPFRASSKSGTPDGALFSFAPASIEPAREERERCRSSSARSSSRATTTDGDKIHPFPFRSPSASPGIPERLYTYQRSSSAGRRSASQKSLVDLADRDVADLRRADVSRRSGGPSVQRHEHDGYEKAVSKVVAARLGDASDNSTMVQPRPMVMRRVRHDCLRAEEHERWGRKASIDDLKKPLVIPADRVMEAAPNIWRLDNPLALCDMAMPFCPHDVRRKLSLMSKAANTSYAALACEASPHRDSLVAEKQAVQRQAEKVVELPEAFVEALQSFAGPPPKQVLAMARVVTPLLEQDAHLCQLADATIAWKLLQGRLSTTFASQNSTSGRQRCAKSFLRHLATVDLPGLELAEGLLKLADRPDVKAPLLTTPIDDPCRIIVDFVAYLCRLSEREQRGE